MTITNHIRAIEDLAELLIEYVDDREYSKAQIVIDAIEERTRLAREHIDHLQLISERTFFPACENTP